MITYEQRRSWTRHILGKPELTATQKNVLLALETYSDYRDGSNAHPGESKLAAVCGITTRAVRTALERGRQLGLIERTAVENPKARKAAVYRIVLVTAPTTGTAVPVNNPTTGTVVPLVRPITGTAVPVHNSTTGTATPLPPERPFLPPESFTRTTGGLPKSGTSPAPVDDPHTDEPPSRFCDRHPRGYRGKCGDCGNARTAFNAWQAAAATRDVALAAAADFERRRRRKAIDDCPNCDDYGRIDISTDPDEVELIACKHSLDGLPQKLLGGVHA